ncbi:hypothetical protein RCH09_001459 [Actimicrobium sp. GrIS 1.19]|uniref:hypothetical protein n=1 Tax=Actimicrobium sp. GrIS 1.19 TaxID=3071708 RepID=UPI002E0405DB|nr:hypothetical protein [Actimicrobium sp. GrIS 1.19]
MTNFDDIQVSRPALAEGYLALLAGQPGRPIALFAPRRIGKTWFLKNDLVPIAQRAGYLAVYADLWLQRSAPLEAINYAIEEALDDVTVPSGAIGRIAKTPIKRIAGVEFGAEPARRPLPDNPALRFDALILKLARASGKPILLMLDEIQALAESADGAAVIASIRAVLSHRQAKVSAVFTGSSQAALSSMMSTVGAPMYQFTQLLDFPTLGDDYLKLLAKHFRSVHPAKALDLAALREAFAYIGYKPALIKDIVKEMSAEGNVDVAAALRKFTASERQVAGWEANFAVLAPIEQALLVALAHGLAPLARDTLELLSRSSGDAVTISRVRAALERLKKAGVLAKPGSGYLIEDRLFMDYIAGLNLPKMPRPERKLGD